MWNFTILVKILRKSAETESDEILKPVTSDDEPKQWWQCNYYASKIQDSASSWNTERLH